MAFQKLLPLKKKNFPFSTKKLGPRYNKNNTPKKGATLLHFNPF